MFIEKHRHGLTHGKTRAGGPSSELEAPRREHFPSKRHRYREVENLGQDRPELTLHSVIDIRRVARL